jgi:Asp-tRNA(Asn)/Glu-tRNA(Gln) amidotransferase A subunit family amidase
MSDLHYLNLSELARLIEKRDLSSVEVTQAQLDRISSLDRDLNAYALVTGSQALADAREADAAISRGQYLGPLHGVPIAVKDLCYTRGVATKAGTAVHENFLPDYDATVVTKLRARALYCSASSISPKAQWLHTIRNSTRLTTPGNALSRRGGHQAALGSQQLQACVSDRSVPTRVVRFVFLQACAVSLE